jgi:hypothetical protein
VPAASPSMYLSGRNQTETRELGYFVVYTVYLTRGRRLGLGNLELVRLRGRRVLDVLDLGQGTLLVLGLREEGNQFTGLLGSKSLLPKSGGTS